MILEQIENIGQHIYDTDNDICAVARNYIGVAVNLSGHMLTITNRCTAPWHVRPSAAIERKQITEFSASSAQRLRKYLRESVAEYSVMLTLTYPYGCGYDGIRAKRDLKVFMQRLRRSAFFTGIDASAFWFAEFQSRGSIHFHIFINRRVPKEWCAKNWYEICGTDDKRHLHAGTRIESIRSGRHGISAYAAKYAAKQSQKKLPLGMSWIGRFWGVCGDRRVVSADTWFSVQSIRSKALIRRIMTLEDTISDMIFKGQARYVHTKHHGMSAIYIRDKSMCGILRMLIDLCEITGSLYEHRSVMWPELNYDISKEGDEYDVNM